MAVIYTDKLVGEAGVHPEDIINYSDTDSCYVCVSHLVKDDSKGSDIVEERAGIMEEYINSEYLSMGMKYMNVSPENNFLDMKQEVVLESTIYTGKRRYLQKIIKEKGKEKLEYNVKGLEIKKANLNTSYRELGHKIVKLLLDYGDKNESDLLITNFISSLNSRDVKTISKRSTVKDMEKGILRNEFGLLTYSKKDSVPSHVRASINYNNYLEGHSLTNKYKLINSGSKVYYFWLLDNPWGLINIAIPESTPPKEISEFISKFINIDKLFETEMSKKIQVLYDAIGWELNFNEELSFNDVEEW